MKEDQISLFSLKSRVLKIFHKRIVSPQKLSSMKFHIYLYEHYELEKFTQEFKSHGMLIFSEQKRYRLRQKDRFRSNSQKKHTYL